MDADQSERLGSYTKSCRQARTGPSKKALKLQGNHWRPSDTLRGQDARAKVIRRIRESRDDRLNARSLRRPHSRMKTRSRKSEGNKLTPHFFLENPQRPGRQMHMGELRFPMRAAPGDAVLVAPTRGSWRQAQNSGRIIGRRHFPHATVISDKRPKAARR